MNERFSKRHGYKSISREITIRNDAPIALREFIIQLIYELGYQPLDKAIEKIWGFSSEQGRHLREGGSPEYNEAGLLVGVSAALSTYLAKKLPRTTIEASEADTDFPF